MKLLLAVVVFSCAALGIAAPDLVNITIGDPALTLDPVSAWGRLTLGQILDGCPPSVDTPFLTTTTVGSSLTATFTGTAVSLIGVVDKDRGIVSVVLDNQAPTSVDATAGATSRRCAPIWSQAGLESKSHTLVITVTRVLESSKFEFLALIVTPPGSSSQPPSASNTSLPSNTSTPAPATQAVSPGLIAGVVVGVIVIIAAAVFAFFFIRRRRRQNRKANIIREPSFATGGPHPDPYPRVSYRDVGPDGVDLLAEPTPYNYTVEEDPSDAPPSSYPASSYPASSYPASNHPTSTGPTSNYAASEVPEGTEPPHEMAQLYPPPLDGRSEAGRSSVYSGMERPGARTSTVAPLSEKARYEADRQRRERQRSTALATSLNRSRSQSGTEAFLTGALSQEEVDRIAQRLAQIRTGPPPSDQRESTGAAPPAYQG